MPGHPGIILRYLVQSTLEKSTGQTIFVLDIFQFGCNTLCMETTTQQPDLGSYDKVIIAFSGGKDSLACLLHVLDSGVQKDRIELWHHDVDGQEGSTLMDWPVTRDYCRKVAEAFNLPLYFSWKEGGFEREMNRDNSPTAPTWFETPDGLFSAGGNGPAGTRKKFPQVGADLKTRWCSAYLKIDVCSASIRNQDRFNGIRTLIVTGEKAEESKSRSKYKEFEPHRAHAGKRHIDAWRPVHKWTESQVWDIIKRYKVQPHPAYVLGWGRVSCAACIFGSRDQWASLAAIHPKQVAVIAQYEKDFGCTIQRSVSVPEQVKAGKPYAAITAERAELALSHVYTGSIITDQWELPAGAYGESCGPT